MNYKKYNAILVGCGQMSHGWLSSLRNHFPERIQVVALVDLELKNAHKRAEEFGLQDVWIGQSLDAALAAVRADILFNCTVPEAHKPTCLAALRAGCNVLVEKPLASTVAEGREMIAAADQAGRVLAVIQNRRYRNAGETVRRAIASGVIGKIHTVCVDFFAAPRFGGFRDAMKHPLLLDMAIHTFDQARYLCGFNAKTASCHEFNPSGSWYAHDASAFVIFEMTDGAVFNYRGSWCAQGLPTSWQGTWRIVGDKGTLLWDGEEGITLERVVDPWDGHSFMQSVESPALVPVVMEPSALDHSGNIREFLDSLDQGTQPQTRASDNLHSLAMVEGAVSSAEAKQSVLIAS